jgi:hypothetical protein
MAIAGIGRPSSYTEAIGKEICRRLSGGESILKMCEDESMPSARSVYNWAVFNEEFVRDYTRARQAWAVHEFERMMQIMDEPCYHERVTTKNGVSEVTRYEAVEHRRLQIDTRKWALARMFPKVYGEAMQLRHADANGDQLTFRVEDARQRVSAGKVLDIPAAEQSED